MLVLFVLAALQGGSKPDTLTVTLGEAVSRALAASPAVAAALGDIHRVQGQRAENLLPFASNPEFIYGRTQRTTPATTVHDRDWLISQEIEIAGQSFTRRSASSAFLLAAESRVADARRVAGLDVRQAYLSLALAERQFALVDTTARFAERLAGFARQQFDAGEINRLELNTAVLDAARTRSAAERARAAIATTAAELARQLAVPPDSVLRTAPLPALPVVHWDSTAWLLPLAQSRRPDLIAADAQLQGAGKTLSAAKRAFIPNLTIAAVGGQESGTDDLLGFQVGVQIPLFYNGQAARGAAEAALATARAEQSATTRGIQAELQAAIGRFRSSAAAEQQFAQEVLTAASENVNLTEQALREGEVNLTDVIVLRRTALDAQLEYLAVLANAYTAWFEVAAALDVDPLELPVLLTGNP